MTSEIRANTIKNRVGLGTVSFTNTGPIVSGIITANGAHVGSGVTIESSGQYTSNNNVRISSNSNNHSATARLQLGSDQNFEIYHNASRDNIIDVDRGNLVIMNSGSNLPHGSAIINRTDGQFLVANQAQNKYRIKAYDGGAVELYYNNVERFETTSQGINVIGHSELDNVNITGVTTVSNKVQVNSLGIGIQPIDHHHIHIESANPRVLIRSTGTNSAKILFGDSSSNDPGVIEYQHSTNYMRFGTGNTEDRLVIQGDGNVGVNTSSVSIAGMSRYLSVSARNVTNGGAAVELVGARTGSDQTLGVINFVNQSSNVAQITAKYQGSTTTGSLQFFTSGTERLRIDSTGVARFINSTGELKIASSTNNDSGKIIFQENTAGAWSLEAQRANGYFRILDEYNGNSGSPQERFRITPAGQVSISDDGTTDGLLTIKGNSDATGTPSIRLLDGSDTREVSITNQSGDFIVSTHGTDNVSHGSIKIYDSGIIALATNGGAGNAERLRVDLNGSMRHMGTGGYWQITVIHNGSGSGNWYSGSAPQQIYPNYIDNRTGYAEFLIEFNPSTSYSGWEEPTFVICGGDGGLRTGGTIELNTNRRTNSPNNGQFRCYHGEYSWQIYNDGDTDQTSGQREINRNVEHRSSTFIASSTQSVDYVPSNDSRYGTNVEPIIDQRSYIKIKMTGVSNYNAVQGHPFICRFVCYSQGDKNWFAYMQYN